MAKRQTLRGNEVMLWLDNKVVAASTSCKLDLTANTEDGGTKDDGEWDSPEIVGLKWSATNESFDCVGIEGLTNDMIYADLFDEMVRKHHVAVTMCKPNMPAEDGVPEEGWKASAGTMIDPIFKGTAIITSLSRDMTVGSRGKINVSLSGVGALTSEYFEA